ncbi:unnamed protein product [Calypogeia fissa]
MLSEKSGEIYCPNDFDHQLNVIAYTVLSKAFSMAPSDVAAVTGAVIPIAVLTVGYLTYMVQASPGRFSHLTLMTLMAIADDIDDDISNGHQSPANIYFSGVYMTEKFPKLVTDPKEIEGALPLLRQKDLRVYWSFARQLACAKLFGCHHA